MKHDILYIEILFTRFAYIMYIIYIHKIYRIYIRIWKHYLYLVTVYLDTYTSKYMYVYGNTIYIYIYVYGNTIYIYLQDIY